MKMLQIFLVGLIIGIGPVSGSFAGDEGLEVVAVDAAGWESFGRAVAVSDTAKYALVGAPRANAGEGAALEDAGAVYPYVRKGEVWEDDVPFRIGALPPVGVDNFGFSVSMSGNTAIVGCPGRDDGAEDSGAAYILIRTGDGWRHQAKLLAGDAKKGDRFGTSVSISGNTAIVAAPVSDDAGTSSGSAYIFERDGITWTQQAKLTANDDAERDEFGTSVSISGSLAIVGAPFHGHTGVRDAGAAYIFEKDGETWTQRAELRVEAPARRDKFGISVAIGGFSALVGAPFRDDAGKDSGAVYIFEKEGDAWPQKGKLIPNGVGETDQFGSSVSILENVAIAGAIKDDDTSKDAGAVYSFERINGAWVEKAKLAAREDVRPEEFPLRYGVAVGIGKEFAIVGADNVNWAGAAYIYTIKDDLDLSFPVEPSGLKPITLGQVKHTALYQNFPNPFNPETWLPYRLADEAGVTFRIYNVQGHLVRQLPLGVQQAGTYLDKQTAAYWDGRDLFGAAVSSGLYVYTLEAGSFQETRRMVILK